MWHGVTYVEPTRRTIVYEGHGEARLVVINAGPGVVELSFWAKPLFAGQPASPPDALMVMPPGNTRAICGSMVGLGLSDDQSLCLGQSRFAAVGWRLES